MMKLTKWGHDEENGQQYTIWTDSNGLCWTYDPDLGNGGLCPCHPWKVAKDINPGRQGARDARTMLKNGASEDEIVVAFGT